MIDLQGTFRTITAEQTLDFITPLLPKFGITRVADITGLDCVGVPVYQSIRPQSKCLSLSQGKGITHALAKVSAIMESIETWHAENIKTPDLIGSYSELHHQYRLVLPQGISHSPFKCQDLTRTRLSWIKVTDLRNQCDVYAPYPFFHLNVSEFPDGFELYLPTSNGLASGNTIEEALCHGLYEIIERDAVAKSVRGISKAFPIDLGTIECPFLRALIQRIESKHVCLSLFDITSDVQIPTIAAFLDGSQGLRWIKNSHGFGTHHSRETAASRAITEALQARLTLISGARDDLNDSDYLPANQLTSSRVYRKQEIIPFYSTNSKMPSSFSECLDTLLERLEKTGHDQAFYYDHTREKLGIPVIHAIVPGMLF